jgi:hypothetical protein
LPIRLIAAEKASGGLKLLVQLPYRLTDLVAPKFAALLAAWLIALIPVLSALVCWGLIGGHLDARETATLMLGHLLYALVIGAISFLVAALTEGGATAAIAPRAPASHPSEFGAAVLAGCVPYSVFSTKSLSAPDSAPQTSPLRPASCRTPA